MTREALDIINEVELFKVEKSVDALNAKKNLENCYALGSPLNCSDQVAEFRKIASSL